MLSPADITTFVSDVPPPGKNPWVDGAEAQSHISIEPWDPQWGDNYTRLEQRIRAALGLRALDVEHVGSTSVPGLPAKPVIDIDLAVADPAAESEWLPQLEEAGFRLVIREPWWYEHRALRHHDPRCNLHVFGPGNPETVRHRLFRDWLERLYTARVFAGRVFCGSRSDCVAPTLVATPVGSSPALHMRYGGRKEVSMARSTSFRISDGARQRLASRAAQEGVSATALLDQLIVEGVDQLDYPGIVFRGPTHDRRAGLAAGPDVWELVSRLQELHGPEEQRVATLSAESDLHPRLIRLALDYAADHPEPIRERIERNRAMAERSRRSVAQRQALLA